jgi:hypothetical protein
MMQRSRVGAPALLPPPQAPRRCTAGRASPRRGSLRCAAAAGGSEAVAAALSCARPGVASGVREQHKRAD